MPEHHSEGRKALLVLHRCCRATGNELTEPELPEVHTARLDELTPRALLGILAVRQAVFVVEQNCVYPDIDASDAGAETRHLWIEDADGEVVSTLRLLRDAGGGHRIGRVATHAGSRGRGYSSALMRRAIELADLPIVLSAQSYLVGWYGTFGFEEHGERWIEDGIEHAPMRLEVRR
ncbi:MAG TPA: GNAT family N-acetyltransferase [Candidatus Dormibacteraeota bacterium]